MTMTITLANGATTLALPPDLIWVDRLTWSPVTQNTERSITGALIVDAAARVGGRSITLQGDGDSAWIALSMLQTLRTWSETPGLQMQLTWGLEPARTVIFDHGSDETSNAMAMQAVVAYSDPQGADYYCDLALRFLEV